MKKIILLLCTIMCVANAYAQTLLWDNQSHPDPREVYGVAFTNDGTKVLSGSECSETRLRLWDVLTGNMLWEYQLDSSLMCTAGVKFSSNGSYLAALEEFGNLLLFDLTSGTPALANSIYTGTVGAFAVDFSPTSDKIVTGCTNNKMIIYDVASASVLHNITAHTGYVFSVAWSHNGQFIATAGQDNKVKVWDTSGTLISTLNGHTADVYDVKFSPNDDYLVSGSQDNTIKIWDRITGNVVYTITGHTNDVRSIAISPDGNYILSGATDATTRIWDFNTHAQLASFNQTGAGSVYTVAWSPTENKIVTGTQFNKVLLWDVQQTVGITEITSNEDVSIYQNPVSDFIILNDNSKNNFERYEIYSLQGKILDNGVYMLGKRINTSGLPPSVYSIRLCNAKKTKLLTFIKR